MGGTYTNDDREAPKEWSYSRTWTDFVKLDKEMRKKYPDQLKKLPPKPYLVGEEVKNKLLARSSTYAHTM